MMNNKKEEIWLHTQNPRRFPFVPLLLYFVSTKSLTISLILLRNMSLSQKNQQPVLECHQHNTTQHNTTKIILLV